MARIEQTEVVIIGAGPSGAIAAALLRKQGRAVLVLERETFPRFSIGESLLPQSMAFIEQAGLLQDVVEAGFQYKNGAFFARGEDETTFFDFREKWSKGWGTTYQVQRGIFDKVLADGAAKTGAEFRYQQTVLAAEVDGDAPALTVKDNASGDEYCVEARFILDASGFGRVLPVAIALVILQVIASGLNLLGANQHLATALWGGFLLLIMVVRSIWASRFLQHMFGKR